MTTPEAIEMLEHDKSVTEQIEKYSFQIDRMRDYATNYPVVSKWAAEAALAFAGEAKVLGKKIETTRKEILEPARKFTNHVNDIARAFTDKLQEVETIVKRKVDAWKQKHEEEQRRAEQDAIAMKESLQLDIVPHVTEDVSTLKSANTMAYEKTEWHFDITEINDVPRQYLMIDEAAIKLAMKNGIREIPGLRIFSQQRTVIRSR